MTKMVAKRVGPDFHLFTDGMKVPFGKLVDCELCHIFESDDERLDYEVDAKLEGDMSLREMLDVVRKAYEAVQAGYAEEMEADRETDRRMDAFYEGRTDACWAENQADLAAFNEQFPNGYGV